MIKILNLFKFTNVLISRKTKKDIQLKVEGKRLKSGKYIINIKSLEVSEEVFNSLGLEAKEDVVKENKAKKQPTLREEILSLKEIVLSNRDLILAMDAKFTERFDKVEERLSNIEQLPTIARELKTQKRMKVLNK